MLGVNASLFRHGQVDRHARSRERVLASRQCQQRPKFGRANRPQDDTTDHAQTNGLDWAPSVEHVTAVLEVSVRHDCRAAKRSCDRRIRGQFLDRTGRRARAISSLVDVGAASGRLECSRWVASRPSPRDGVGLRRSLDSRATNRQSRDDDARYPRPLSKVADTASTRTPVRPFERTGWRILCQGRSRSRCAAAHALSASVGIGGTVDIRIVLTVRTIG